MGSAIIAALSTVTRFCIGKSIASITGCKGGRMMIHQWGIAGASDVTLGWGRPELVAWSWNGFCVTQRFVDNYHFSLIGSVCTTAFPDCVRTRRSVNSQALALQHPVTLSHSSGYCNYQNISIELKYVSNLNFLGSGARNLVNSRLFIFGACALIWSAYDPKL